MSAVFKGGINMEAEINIDEIRILVTNVKKKVDLQVSFYNQGNMVYGYDPRSLWSWDTLNIIGLKAKLEVVFSE